MTYEQLMQEKGGSEAFMQDLTEQMEKQKQADIKSGKFFTDELKRDKNDYIYNDPSIKKAYLDMKSKNHNVEVNPKTDLNNFTFDSNTQQNQMQEPQPLSPSGEETLAIANNLQQPTRYRNTGIDYFDRLEKPTIGDLFLAKNLGLNMQYTFLDANINGNFNQKITNRNKAINQMYAMNNSIIAYTQGIDEYMRNDLGSVGNRLSRAFNRFTGGSLPFTSDENKREQGLNEIRAIARTDATYGQKAITSQKERDYQRSLSSTNYKDEDSFIADTNNFLTFTRNKQQEEINKITELGMQIPLDEQLKLHAIDNMIKATTGGYDSDIFVKNRDAIMLLQQNKGDENAINQAVKIIFSK